MEAGFIPRLEQQCCSLGVHWDHPLILIIISWHQSLLLSHCTIHHTGPSITLGQPSHWSIHHTGPTITLDLLSSHPVHNHLGIVVLSFYQHSRSQSERREYQHFSSVKSRTGKGWSKPVVWNFSLCENLWRACYNTSQWVPLQGVYSTEG